MKEIYFKEKEAKPAFFLLVSNVNCVEYHLKVNLAYLTKVNNILVDSHSILYYLKEKLIIRKRQKKKIKQLK